MSNIACAPSQPWRGVALLLTYASRLTRKAALALQVHVERRRLLSLDDAALKDMGFNKGQAQCEASRTFWDLPVDRLRA